MTEARKQQLTELIINYQVKSYEEMKARARYEKAQDETKMAQQKYVDSLLNAEWEEANELYREVFEDFTKKTLEEDEEIAKILALKEKQKQEKEKEEKWWKRFFLCR